jgi:hypothetical protein
MSALKRKGSPRPHHLVGETAKSWSFNFKSLYDLYGNHVKRLLELVGIN